MDDSIKKNKKSEKNAALKLRTYSNGYHIAALKSVHFMDKQQDSFSCTRNHTHNFYELAIVLRGAGFHIVADQKMPIRPGSIFLLCPGEYHRYEYSGSLTLLNFMFDSISLRPFRAQLADLPGYRQLFQRGTPKGEFHVDSATIAELDILLNTMTMESRQQMPWSSLLLTINLVNALVLIIQKLSQGKVIHGSSDIAPAVSFMLRNYQNTLHLSQLSRMANLSESSFYRKFNNEFGMPPMKWLLQLRIHRAMEFLIRSDMTIAEIAAATGFSDSLYFSRQFRKLAGCSPRNYRLRDHGQRQEILGNLISVKDQ